VAHPRKEDPLFHNTNGFDASWTNLVEFVNRRLSARDGASFPDTVTARREADTQDRMAVLAVRSEPFSTKQGKKTGVLSLCNR